MTSRIPSSSRGRTSSRPETNGRGGCSGGCSGGCFGASLVSNGALLLDAALDPPWVVFVASYDDVVLVDLASPATVPAVAPDVAAAACSPTSAFSRGPGGSSRSSFSMASSTDTPAASAAVGSTSAVGVAAVAPTRFCADVASVCSAGAASAP
eukprot:3899459-Prymnesium_polylepis.2